MGKIYGRTHYWVWHNNTLHRVVLSLGGYIMNGRKTVCFTFKDKPGQEYYGPSTAFAKTKKLAIDNKDKMEACPFEVAK